MRTGRAYLIKEGNPNNGFEIFTALVNNGNKGICVSGIYPDDIKKKYDLGKAHFIWLTQNMNINKNYIHPSNISRLGFMLKNFLRENKNAAIFLEGFEHLFAHNRYGTVMSMLYTIGDEVAVNNAKMLVLVDPFALTKKQMAFLENETEGLIL